MKIVTIIGARPQFIKAATISRAIAEQNRLIHYSQHLTELIIHTGQHFDNNMSDIFFKELNIPEPDYNLGIDSTTHGAMTGRMLEEIEKILVEESPDVVIVYGDTNSTLAGALAAAKLHIPVAHVEAGLRSFNMQMPEEINRILADRISTILFCPTEIAVKNLRSEGFTNIVNNGKLIESFDNSPLDSRFSSLALNVGDVMYDAALFYSDFAEEKSDIIETLYVVPDKYVLCTIHRAENTDNLQRLTNIIIALKNIAYEIDVVLPLHPRTKKVLSKANITTGHIKVIDPVSYFDMIKLEKNCSVIITDSGGVQKEAYFYQKSCITLRDETEWTELEDEGVNFVVGTDVKKILDAFGNFGKKKMNFSKKLYGKGDTGKMIVNFLFVINKKENKAN